jgi:hypothetical protein
MSTSVTWRNLDVRLKGKVGSTTQYSLVQFKQFPAESQNGKKPFRLRYVQNGSFAAEEVSSGERTDSSLTNLTIAATTKLSYISSLMN